MKFGDFNLTCFEFCQTIDTKFFQHKTLFQQNDRDLQLTWNAKRSLNLNF